MGSQEELPALHHRAVVTQVSLILKLRPEPQDIPLFKQESEELWTKPTIRAIPIGQPIAILCNLPTIIQITALIGRVRAIVEMIGLYTPNANPNNTPLDLRQIRGLLTLEGRGDIVMEGPTEHHSRIQEAKNTAH
jgi:hypothetical protein